MHNADLNLLTVVMKASTKNVGHRTCLIQLMYLLQTDRHWK